ncbi:UDP-glucuronosyl/UDP-glucosyltransferase [Artemisia annua]|uniref:UDP-glucuronosyl/UDP-glucosyltransferase n=1 Tax=Artemisia annua TaxID=35608 RepID=A0A2U1NQH1_ARTAN|nr:UDP-glucuronosyl/UDP-glucosyltransferase [Artemisia annua]
MAKCLHSNKTLSVSFLELPFPGVENGVPEGSESADALPGLHLLPNFSVAVDMLQHRLCVLNVISKMLDEIHESEPFVLLGLPDRIEITKDQLPHELNHSPIAVREHHERVRETESKAYGMVINSFKELEQDYLKEFKKLKEGVENGLPERCESADALPGLHLLPNFSVAVDILQNQLTFCSPGITFRIEITKDQLPHEFNLSPIAMSEHHERVRETESKAYGMVINSFEDRLLTWLDLKEPGSVVYACFGGSSRVIPSPTNQGLEASDRSLKWVIKSSGRAQEVEKWLLESRFEDRVKDR